jgi:hypothetical protein
MSGLTLVHDMANHKTLSVTVHWGNGVGVARSIGAGWPAQQASMAWVAKVSR